MFNFDLPLATFALQATRRGACTKRNQQLFIQTNYETLIYS